MKISVMGTGNMGKALVKQFAANSKNSILWGSRNPEEAKQLVETLALPNTMVCTYEEAQQADILIPTFHTAILKNGQ
ncbi:NAD(P)-binding domain-containing protein [Paenibacillus hexagrammi]|uniref:NAD(P)-binding domain-containing protein n=1 Tax=Paenibacillus hexagrammi TaxID=2908839 RepID=A0ABY3SBU4_9BACL|nr:NAD(P)-binding domain-containing protein [Paenibacillus sp. YPD9-1]UJF31458.1 NAD(P)-binding domain-containing protein [Paenibacillus sp. YPD9-1]